MKTDTNDRDPASPIDTSKMSAGQRAALEMTEAARDAFSADRGFCGGLFMGRSDLSALHPFPMQSSADAAAGANFLDHLEKFLVEKVDADEIDRSGEIPDEVIAGLAKLGAFGIKIPKEYGGLGLSQTNYCRAAMLLGSVCGNLTALLSAHQSIGVPQPLLMFGTDEQKKKFLPRVAAGEISAFALTEREVGSDPARMSTSAAPTEDGKHFVINGEKLWCTNGVKAGVIVVMAKTPSPDGKSRITAFVVPMDTPGVEVVRRCHFMGLRALYNGVIRFTNAKVPRENIILAEGKGLRVALSTLNTGRLTLPAACVGLAERCVLTSKEWSVERTQWGAPIGKHAAIADKLARMAARTFAMRAMVLYAASLVDKDKKADVRLEAAMCKMWAAERAWEIVDDTLQIRGGRGYETAASLKARGEEPVAVERWMRDCRINLIFEGSSEIMRLFIAREALDPHLKAGGPVMDSRIPLGSRAGAALKAGAFYAPWYLSLFNPFPAGFAGVDARLAPHGKYAARVARRLARGLFHAMAKHGPKLEREQVLLGRFVDIATETFALVAACSYADKIKSDDPSAIDLADHFSRDARLKIEGLFRALHANNDKSGYKLAQKLTGGAYDREYRDVAGA